MKYDVTVDITRTLTWTQVESESAEEAIKYVQSNMRELTKGEKVTATKAEKSK